MRRARSRVGSGAVMGKMVTQPARAEKKGCWAATWASGFGFQTSAPGNVVHAWRTRTRRTAMLSMFFTDPEVIHRVVSGIAIFCATTVLSFVAGRAWGKYQARK